MFFSGKEFFFGQTLPRSVQNTNFFLQILVDGSPKRSWLTKGGKNKKTAATSITSLGESASPAIWISVVLLVIFSMAHMKMSEMIEMPRKLERAFLLVICIYIVLYSLLRLYGRPETDVEFVKYLTPVR